MLVACILRPWVSYTADAGEYVSHGLLAGRACTDVGCRSISVVSGHYGLAGTLALAVFACALIGALAAIASAIVLLRERTRLTVAVIAGASLAAVLALALFGQIGRDLVIARAAWVFFVGIAIVLAGSVVALAQRRPVR